MTRTPLKSYAVTQGVAVIKPVAINKNGYPFVSLIMEEKGADDKHLCKNIWFTKRASKEVVLGDKVKDLPPLFILEVVNDNGEPRTKLDFGQDDSMTSIDEIPM